MQPIDCIPGGYTGAKACHENPTLRISPDRAGHEALIATRADVTIPSAEPAAMTRAGKNDFGGSDQICIDEKWLLVEKGFMSIGRYCFGHQF